VFHHPGHRRQTQHQHHLHQETHVDADGASHFSISGFDLISYTLHAKHDIPARLSNGKQTDAVIQATVCLPVQISRPPNVGGLLTNYFMRTLQIGLELTRRTVACVAHSRTILCLKLMTLNLP